jgi:hypothetical protein
MGQYRVIDDLLEGETTEKIIKYLLDKTKHDGYAVISDSKLARDNNFYFTEQIEKRIKYIIDSGIFSLEKTGVGNKRKNIYTLINKEA